MHLVSCRHSTSGRADLMNFATRSMRSRTELMFQVVRERRMEPVIIVVAKSASDEAIQRTGKISALARRGRVGGEVDLEHARIDLLGRVEIIDGDRGVIALRIGH